MISHQQIKYALSVAKHKNFKKAADNCFVSPSTLSNGIVQLEKYLNIQVFERDNKKVLITKKGETILEKLRAIKIQYDDLEKISNTLSGLGTNDISLGIIPTIGPYLLPIVLPHLNKKYPDISLNIIEGKSDEILEKVREGEIDMAIIALPYDIKGLLSFKFWSEEFFWVTHNDNLIDNAQQIGSDGIKKANLMLLEEGHCLKEHALAACNIKQQNKYQVKASNLSTLIELVAGKMGSTLVPQIALHQLIKPRKKLRALPLDEPGPHREIAIIIRPAYPNIKNMEILKEEFATSLAKSLSMN